MAEGISSGVEPLPAVWSALWLQLEEQADTVMIWLQVDTSPQASASSQTRVYDLEPSPLVTESLAITVTVTPLLPLLLTVGAVKHTAEPQGTVRLHAQLIVGGVLLVMVNVALVVAVLPQASLAVKVTVMVLILLPLQLLAL